MREVTFPTDNDCHRWPYQTRRDPEHDLSFSGLLAENVKLHELEQAMFVARTVANAMRTRRSNIYKGVGATAVVAGIVGMSQQSPRANLSHASFSYNAISNAHLAKLEDGEEIDPSSLWAETGAVFFAIRRPGWGFVREQGRLLAQLELGDVPLIGVVHELVDNEPQEFQRAAFNGNHHIIHDSSKAFFPLPTSLASVFTPQFVRNTITLVSSGLPAGNNFAGDYKYASGVVVVGPGDQGILYQSSEATLGDQTDTDAVLDAVAKFEPVPAHSNREEGGEEDKEDQRRSNI